MTNKIFSLSSILMGISSKPLQTISDQQSVVYFHNSAGSINTTLNNNYILYLLKEEQTLFAVNTFTLSFIYLTKK